MYTPILLPHFRRQLKPLAKKHPGIEGSITGVVTFFAKDQGIHLGHDVYKLRLSPASFARGKSKSFRLMILLIEERKIAIPLTIYYKGDKQNVTKKEVNDHLEIIFYELHQCYAQQ